MIGYLGIDWSSKTFDSALAVGTEAPRAFKKATRNLDSVRQVLQAAQQTKDVDELHVVIETGAPGWVQMLHQVGAKVFVVDCKQAKAFSDSLRSSGAKSDRTDALMLARMGQSPSHALHPWTPSDPLSTALDELVAERMSTTEERIRAVQTLRSLLRERAFDLENVLSVLHRAWVCRLLRAIPTAWHARQIDRVQFDQIMKGSGARRSTRDKVWKAIQLLSQHDENPTVAEARKLRVHTLIDRVETLTASIDRIDNELARLTQDLDIKKVLTSVDGINDTLAHQLLSLGFDLSEPPKHRDEVATRIGAAPVFVGSGEKSGKTGAKKGYAKMRRSASARARRTCYLLGRLASQQLEWARAMYQDARQRGQNAATAYRRIARSLLRILSAMVRYNEPYDEARYIKALQANGVSWAAGLTPAAQPAT